MNFENFDGNLSSSKNSSISNGIRGIQKKKVFFIRESRSSSIFNVSIFVPHRRREERFGRSCETVRWKRIVVVVLKTAIICRIFKSTQVQISNAFQILHKYLPKIQIYQRSRKNFEHLRYYECACGNDVSVPAAGRSAPEAFFP